MPGQDRDMVQRKNSSVDGNASDREQGGGSDLDNDIIPILNLPSNIESAKNENSYSDA